MIGTQIVLTANYQLISSAPATITIEEQGSGAVTFNTSDAVGGLPFLLDAGRQVKSTSARDVYAKGEGYVLRVDLGA